MLYCERSASQCITPMFPYAGNPVMCAMLVKYEVKVTECQRENGDSVGDRVDTCQRLKLEAVICAGILPPEDQWSKGIGQKRPERLQHGKALKVREAIKPAQVKGGEEKYSIKSRSGWWIRRFWRWGSKKKKYTGGRVQ